MELTDNIKNLCKEEYEKNYSTIQSLSEKIRYIKANSIENKALITAVYAFFYNMALIILATLTMSIFPPMSINLALTSILINISGILLGILTEKKVSKDYKYLKKLREFSNSKTDEEKMDEYVRYEIEKKKLESLNRILFSQQKYDKKRASIFNKGTDIDANTITENINTLNETLKEKYNLLNSLSTKYVLEENFSWIKNKKIKNSNIKMLFLIGLVFGLESCSAPSLIFFLLNKIPMLPALGIISSYGILGSLISGIYCLKRIKDSESVFNNINSELKEERLTESLDENSEKYRKEIELLIDEICNLENNLITEKLKLESIQVNADSEDKKRRQEISKEEQEVLDIDGFSQVDTIESTQRETPKVKKRILKRVKKYEV